jgi:hypothetical protein
MRRIWKRFSIGAGLALLALAAGAQQVTLPLEKFEQLPLGATLWSARVDDVAVRPLERGGGKISVPLGFDTGRDAVVEVVSVQAQAIPVGRSELALDVSRVSPPACRAPGARSPCGARGSGSP